MPIAIYLSAWLAMVGWFVGSLAIHEKWNSAARFWLAGCLLLLTHIGIAFHFAHNWSHAVAFEHTRRVGGLGEGIYANYAFAAIWLGDALWLAARPASYFRRPKWLTFAIHGFLLFLVVNAMVLYGTWPGRLLFGLFVAFALARSKSRPLN
jgi:hypothetical protein